MTRLDNAKEGDLKKSIADYLQILENGGNLWYERVNSGNLLVRNEDGSFRRVTLAREGTSDFIIVLYGRPIMLEVKRKGETQSDEQIAFQKKVESVGAIYWLVDNFDDFMNKIGSVLE